MHYDEYAQLQEKRLEALDAITVLTPLDVMEVLNIGKNTAYELLNSGQLQGFRVGRNWRISAKALKEFMLSTSKR